VVPPAGSPCNTLAVTATLACPAEPYTLDALVALVVGGARVAELRATGAVVQQSLELRDAKGQPLQQVGEAPRAAAELLATGALIGSLPQCIAATGA
jgi:hypothetical protein